MIFTNGISTLPKDINFNLVNDYVNNQATIVSEYRPFARNSLKGETNCRESQELADACLKARITHADVITLLKQLDYQVYDDRREYEPNNIGKYESSCLGEFLMQPVAMLYTPTRNIYPVVKTLSQFFPSYIQAILKSAGFLRKPLVC